MPKRKRKTILTTLEVREQRHLRGWKRYSKEVAANTIAIVEDVPKIYAPVLNGVNIFIAGWEGFLIALGVLFVAFAWATMGVRWDISIEVLKGLIEVETILLNPQIDLINENIVDKFDDLFKTFCKDGHFTITTGALIDDLEHLFDIGNVTITGQQLLEGLKFEFDVLKVEAQILFDDTLMILQDANDAVKLVGTLVDLPDLTDNVVNDAAEIVDFFNDLLDLIEGDVKQLLYKDIQIIADATNYAPFESSSPGLLTPDNRTMIIPPISTEDSGVNTGNDANEFLTGDIFRLNDNSVFFNPGSIFCEIDHWRIPHVPKDFFLDKLHIIQILDDIQCTGYEDPLEWVYRLMQLVLWKPATNLANSKYVEWLYMFFTLFVLTWITVPILLIPCCCMTCIAGNSIQYKQSIHNSNNTAGKYIRMIDVWFKDLGPFDLVLYIATLVGTGFFAFLLFLLFIVTHTVGWLNGLWRDFLLNLNPASIPGYLRVSVPILGFVPPDTIPLEPLWCIYLNAGIPVFILLLAVALIVVLAILNIGAYYILVVIYRIFYGAYKLSLGLLVEVVRQQTDDAYIEIRSFGNTYGYYIESKRDNDRLRRENRRTHPTLIKFIEPTSDKRGLKRRRYRGDYSGIEDDPEFVTDLEKVIADRVEIYVTQLLKKAKIITN